MKELRRISIDADAAQKTVDRKEMWTEMKGSVVEILVRTSLRENLDRHPV